MKYSVALSLAAKSTAYLHDKEGNMSEAEVTLHVSALDLALRTIAERNDVTLPPRP